MKTMIFTNIGIKGVILTIVVLFLLVSGYLFLKKVKNDDSAKRKIILSYIGLFVIIFYIVLHFPLYGLMNFDSVEEAYKFQNPEGKMVFKKVVGNTAFVHGAEVYKSEKEHLYPGVFTIYIKDGEHWKAQYEGYEFIKYRIPLESKEGKTYYLYYLYSNEDNITGIFIHALFTKKQFTENTNISDSRKTNFEGFYGLSMSSSDADGYMFLGIIDGKIDEKYYISIENEKYYIKELI